MNVWRRFYRSVFMMSLWFSALAITGNYRKQRWYIFVYKERLGRLPAELFCFLCLSCDSYQLQFVCFFLNSRVLTDLANTVFSNYSSWTCKTLWKDPNLNMHEWQRKHVAVFLEMPLLFLLRFVFMLQFALDLLQIDILWICLVATLVRSLL